jgi:hypothetical protein
LNQIEFAQWRNLNETGWLRLPLFLLLLACCWVTKEEERRVQLRRPNPLVCVVTKASGHHHGDVPAAEFDCSGMST